MAASLLQLPPTVAGTVRERILRAAQSDIPLLEDPPYSNRSAALDALCDRAGIPRGSYWCAAWATDVWTRAGAPVPPIRSGRGWHPAKAQTWYEWAMETMRFHSVIGDAAIGDAVLYSATGKPPAHHIGACVAGRVVVQGQTTQTWLWDFEGNTTDVEFSRNGELACLKRVDPGHVIGFVRPDGGR